MEKKRNFTRIIILSIAAVVLGVAVLYIAALLSMGDRRSPSKETAARWRMTQVYSVVILCIDKGEAIYSPQDGGPVCAGLDHTWPELAPHDASWGGCPFVVEKDAENPEETQFQYCATLSDGSIATCFGGDENGCAFN